MDRNRLTAVGLERESVDRECTVHNESKSGADKLSWKSGMFYDHAAAYRSMLLLGSFLFPLSPLPPLLLSSRPPLPSRRTFHPAPAHNCHHSDSQNDEI